MDFLKRFFRVVTMVPGVIQGTEVLFGKEAGAQKKAAAVEVVGAAINIADAVSKKQIANAGKFTEGLSSIIDGVVTCLNASIWAKE
jgi:hypothetical protein